MSYRFRTSRYRTCRSSRCQSLACPRLTFPPPQHSTSPRIPLPNPRRCCCRRFQNSRSRTQPPSLTCLRLTTHCSRCQNLTYPTCPHCAPKVDVPKFEVPTMPKFDMPAAPPVVYNLNLPIIHNIRRSSNMLYMYKIDAGCSLKWFTASAQIKWYCFKASMTRVIRQFSKLGENICGGDGVMIYLYVQAHECRFCRYHCHLLVDCCVPPPLPLCLLLLPAPIIAMAGCRRNWQWRRLWQWLWQKR